MKSFLALIVVAGVAIATAALLNCSNNKENKQADIDHGITLEKEFQQQTQSWKDAYNSGDAQNLIPLYAEDAKYISSHVAGLEANGREKLIANFQNGINTGGHLDDIEILSMEVSCDIATLLCKYQATNSGQTVSGRNVLVLRKIEGNWLIVLHMTVV